MATTVDSVRLDNTRRHPLRRMGTSHYVLARYRHNRLEFWSLALHSGEEAMPVFSSEESAREFLSSAAEEAGWYARECFTGEMISMLFGPCAKISRVLLDPLPNSHESPDPRDLVRRESYLSTLSGD